MIAYVTNIRQPMTCTCNGMWLGRWSRNGPSRLARPLAYIPRLHRGADRPAQISQASIRNPISHFLEVLTRVPLLLKKWPKPNKKSVNKAGARNKNGPSSEKSRRRCSLYNLYNDCFLWRDPYWLFVGLRTGTTRCANRLFPVASPTRLPLLAAPRAAVRCARRVAPTEIGNHCF